MKEQPSFSCPCKSAAVRVEYLLGKDGTNFLYFDRPTLAIESFHKRYKCDPLKPPKILKHAQYLPLQGYIISRKKNQSKSHRITKGNPSKSLRISIDGKHCSVNQKNYNLLQDGHTLSSFKVSYLQYKEHFLVVKKLKSLSKDRGSSPRRHDVVAIQTSVAEKHSQDSLLASVNYTSSALCNAQVSRIQ